MRPDVELCQFGIPPSYSRLIRPYPAFLWIRLVYQIRQRGLFEALRRGADSIRKSVVRRFKLRPFLSRGARKPSLPPPLGLKPGELVEVLSEQEILATLDGNGTTGGLSFIPEMNAFCGRRYLVFKRLERIMLEETKQIRRLKDTVILQGVLCDGAGIGCDRSCHFFWREAWLKRVEEPQVPQ